MYLVKFVNVAPALDLPFEPEIECTTADLDRAIALASMLQKISTPEVQFGDIIVEPCKFEKNETENNETSE